MGTVLALLQDRLGRPEAPRWPRLPPMSLRAKHPAPVTTAMSTSQQMKKGLCLRVPGEARGPWHWSQDRPLSGAPDRGSWLEPGLARLPAHSESTHTSRAQPQPSGCEH